MSERRGIIRTGATAALMQAIIVSMPGTDTSIITLGMTGHRPTHIQRAGIGTDTNATYAQHLRKLR